VLWHLSVGDSAVALLAAYHEPVQLLDDHDRGPSKLALLAVVADESLLV